MMSGWVGGCQKLTCRHFLDPKNWKLEKIGFAQSELFKKVFDIPLLVTYLFLY